MKRDLDAVMARAPASAAMVAPAALACAFAVVAIVALYWGTAASIVTIWIRSETFAHGFLVVPICLWFVWRRRAELAQLSARPWWPGLIVVAGAGALWLVASAADVQVVRQFTLAFMLQGAIVTIVGLRIARVIAFPLAFFLFAIPFGDFMVPTLIDWTADFTVGALRLSGVPVFREGNHFIIPSGWWSVVEACSGVRYIIASTMVGTMFAAIAYRTPRRRALFVLAAILVPVLANWLRAYMIVMIGHLSDNRLAVGVDHIIYGWVFFGLVMLLLFWVGSKWQEYAPDTPPVPQSPSLATPARLPLGARGVFAAAAAAVVAAGIWLPVDAMTGRGVVHPLPELLPIAGTGGWEAAPAPITDWRPAYGGYAVEYRQSYRKGTDDVGMHIAFYRDQEKGAELVTSGNVLTGGENRDWKQITTGSDQVDWSGRPVTVDRAELRGRALSLEVFRLYWIAGRETANPYVAKALLAWSRLTGRGDDSALIVFYAPSGEKARQALRSFAQSMAGPIDAALVKGAASRR